MKLSSLTSAFLGLMAISSIASTAVLAQTPVPQGPTAPAPVAPAPAATPTPQPNSPPSVPPVSSMPPPPPGGPQQPPMTIQPVPSAYLNSPGIEAIMPSKIVVSGIAATVNGQPITNQYLVTKFLASGAPQFLDELINEQLIRQQAKKEGVTATPAEVNAKLLELKELVLRQYPGQTWAQFLALQDRSESYIRDNVYDGLLAVKLIEKSTASNLVGKVHLYHILKLTVQIPGDPAPESDAQAQQDIENIRALIVSGKATFQQEARLESQDPTASKGGDLGWYGPDARLDPSFAKAAFALKEDEISEPVKSQFGWHLIYAAKFGIHATPAEIAEFNSGPDADARARQGIQAYLKNLKNSSKIVYDILPIPPAPKGMLPSTAFAPQSMPRFVPQPIPKPTTH